MISKLGFDKILESRVHTASMKGSEYFDWRNEIYFENWKSAVRKTFESPDEIIKAYDKLTTEEKLEFMASQAGRITYIYRVEDMVEKVEEIMDTLFEKHRFTVDEFVDISDGIMADYDFEMATPDYIQEEIDAEWNDEDNADLDALGEQVELDEDEVYTKSFNELWNKISRHKYGEE